MDAKDKGVIVYKGNFADDEIASTWRVVNGNKFGIWHYHNAGGRDEDIFFRYDRIDGSDTIRINGQDEASGDFLKGCVISPAIRLEAGKTYEVNYEIRLFGTEYEAETSLMMLAMNDPLNDIDTDKTTVLEHRKWPIDGFQWPVSSIQFSVKSDGEYHIAFKAHNDVPINFYWLSILQLPD